MNVQQERDEYLSISATFTDQRLPQVPKDKGLHALYNLHEETIDNCKEFQ